MYIKIPHSKRMQLWLTDIYDTLMFEYGVCGLTRRLRLAVGDTLLVCCTKIQTGTRMNRASIYRITEMVFDGTVGHLDADDIDSLFSIDTDYRLLNMICSRLPMDMSWIDDPIVDDEGGYIYTALMEAIAAAIDSIIDGLPSVSENPTVVKLSKNDRVKPVEFTEHYTLCKLQ